MTEKCEQCTIRHAHHSDELKLDFTHRLRRIEGQIRGIIRMINEDVYCDDVLNQILAIQYALTSVSKLLLEAHMKSCVVEQIQDGNLEVIDELMKTVYKLLRK